MPPEKEDTRTEIAILKRDLDILASISEKFDVAIDNLGEVTTMVDKMLAIHENRLENQEKQSALLHSRISDFKKEIIDEIKSLKNENENDFRCIKKRIERLETWRWFVVGIATAIGFIFAQLPINKFFQ